MPDKKLKYQTLPEVFVKAKTKKKAPSTSNWKMTPPINVSESTSPAPTRLKENIELERQRSQKNQDGLKEISREDVKNVPDRDTRSLWSDSRAKERGDAFWNSAKKVTAVGQFSPEPISRYSSIALNSLMGAADTYFAAEEGDMTNAKINAVGAIPLPGYGSIKAVKNMPGLSNKQKLSVLKAALSSLGIDLFGTAADLTDNFGLEKQKNGGTSSKTITCTCGHSWNKSDSSKKDATVCHICGKDNVMKNGGWLDNYGEEANANEGYSSASKEWIGEGYSNVGRDYSPAWGGQFEEGGMIPQAQNGKKNKKIKEKTIEHRIDDFLGNPQAGARFMADINPDEDPVDNLRHSFAGRYTQDAIAKKLGNGPIANIAGLVGSNLMGAAHELSTIVKDDRPWMTKLKESGEDMINNAVGSVVGIIPFMDEKAKDKMMYKLSYGNLLPDGYVATEEGKKKGQSDNMYFKNKQGKVDRKYQIGGSLPGSVGFMYARTNNPAPSNGPYAKKTKASAQNGKKISYAQWMDKYNLEETPDYNLKRAWELGYVPDETGHLPTVDNETGQFLKAKGHSTIQKELDWYNSPEGADFKSKNSIDSSGNFFKYVPKGQNGQEMSYYKNGLDWKPKSISRDGSVIKDNRGYWNPDNWGKVVEIDSPDITMKGVDQDLIGISDEGDVKYMTPGKNYKFKGKKVKEYPVGKNGVNQQDEKVDEQLDQLTNFTNYNKPTIGGWLDKY